ncbi:hypothetical protein Z517_06073 [Fonsecaea pedrosoi CBS 271.37]|uniref:Major facilitator superfamily (MFS) profile domain-containing protein n=1 Tax=Fonsecaea pedrosoi CBS 271.37 TaxID=1442368 RepID=A0A0D2DNY7_9EURO|nr:uncharacterized protein Z517_06073 [Fonsecaea pedrosoi CBS 271.37]KIW79461.1 hypothetical protein Z517_06073 [Fonsecaea pedrosoi CBS 271.37]
MGGRYILGLRSVICNASGPAYVVEMAYPAYRGFQTGLYQAMFFCGTVTTTWLEYELSYLPADSVLAWRLPLAMQAIPSLVLLACVYYMPETPLWWMARDTADKAKEILVKYHGDGNENSAIMTLEIYYLPLVVATVGITSVKTKLLLKALQTPVMMIASLNSLYLIDHFNRRTLLMIGGTLMTCSTAIITACIAQHAVSKAVSGTIFLVAFAVCWARNVQYGGPLSTTVY